MSLMDKLVAMSKEHKKADAVAEKSGTIDPKWMSRQKQRNSIPVIVNQTQDLDVLHVQLFEATEDMGECISLLLQSRLNHAMFNVRWFMETKEREGAPARENLETTDLLLQVKEEFGIYENEILSLKGKTISAKVEKIVGFGLEHYRISNLGPAKGDCGRTLTA